MTNSIKKVSLVLYVLGCSLSAAALGDDLSAGAQQAPSNLGQTGQTYAAAVQLSEMEIIARLHVPNVVETQAAQIALKRTNNVSVKKYATMTIEHHSKADMKLFSLAGILGMTFTKMTPADSSGTARYAEG